MSVPSTPLWVFMACSKRNVSYVSKDVTIRGCIPKPKVKHCSAALYLVSEQMLTVYTNMQVKLHTFFQQGAAFNVTRFESRITHLLYTAINTTEHGQVSQCLGFTKSFTSSIQRLGDVLHDNQGIAAISQVHLP